jgi:molybdopterin converting factor small subunit
MTITLNYRGQLAAACGAACEQIDANPATTVLSILKELAGSKGGEFAELLLDPSGGVRRTVLVAADGEQVVDLKAPLGEDIKEITLLPPISGG